MGIDAIAKKSASKIRAEFWSTYESALAPKKCSKRAYLEELEELACDVEARINLRERRVNGGNMKPHEETWEAKEDADGKADIHSLVGGVSVGRVARFGSPEDAKLAAQAPAMARLLLKINDDGQWENRQFDEGQIIRVLRDAGVIP